MPKPKLPLDWELFTRSHLDSFVPNKGYEDYADPYTEWMERQADFGQAGAHFIDGQIVYLSAYFEVVQGTWEVLIIPSIHLPKYIRIVIPDIRLHLKAIQWRHQARRLQTWGDANDVIDRWLKCLGFVCEGTLRQYSIEGDKRIWAITWQDHSQQH
jgi:hypothetical protein